MPRRTAPRIRRRPLPLPAWTWIAVLAVGGCGPFSSATPPSTGPGYRVVPPLAAEDAAAAAERVKAIESIPPDAFRPDTFAATNRIVLRYRLLPPDSVRHGERYPLVVVLHGSGEIGTDNLAQMDRFPKLWARPEIRRGFPSYVLVPQFPARSVVYSGPVEDARRVSQPTPPLLAALELIDSLRRALPIDSERVYAIGFSMGASSVWAALALRPELFAAAIPIAGVPNPAYAATLAATPVWVIHGNRDRATSIDHDRPIYDALRRYPRAQIRFWELDGRGHEVPPELLASDAFPRWLFGHRKQ